MIRVMNGDTIIGQFATIEDLATNFTPRDGRYQDYWYLHETLSRWMPWKTIRKEINRINAKKV